MRVHNDTAYRVGHGLAMYAPGKPFMTVVVKGTFELVEDGPCVAVPPDKQVKIGPLQNFMDVHGNSIKAPSDSVPFKLRADCLFLGAAHAPGGQPVDFLPATFAVGPMRKTLAVYGARNWVRGADGSVSLTKPEPFLSLPIRAEYAHGGLASKYNEHGIGFAVLDDAPGSTVAAANILPANGNSIPWDRDVPHSGFGALAPMLMPRRALLGTFDGNWRVRRRPLPPEDFKVAFFNAAPEDQQVDSYLVGDEEIYLENLHPSAPVFRSALPGSRVRCFVQQRTEPGAPMPHEFAEIHTVLDTCIVNTTDNLVTLLWRGTLEIESRFHENIDDLLVVEEPLDAATPASQYADRLREKLADKRGDIAAARDAERKKAVAAIHQEGLGAAVKALKEAGAPADLIAEIEKSATLEEAQETIAARIATLQATLPKPPEAL